MDLVLFGMQGSGKGTQSRLIAQDCNMEIFETVEALRKLAAEDSELGKKVKKIIEAGHLVPTKVVMEIIKDFISKLPEGKSALFDGLPRSLEQQEQFDKLLKSEGREFKGILIEITEEEALRRLTTRRICSKCKEAYPSFYDKKKCEKCGGKLITRKDDTPDAIRVRLDTFAEKTVPVINNYKERNLMLVVNGEQKIEDVTIEMMEILKTEGLCE